MALRLVAWVAGLLLALGARADDLSLLASPAARCLSVAPGAPTRPVYPPEMDRWKVNATVRAIFTFNAPDAPPEVEIDRSANVPDTFQEAVRAHARNLRVGCMDSRQGPALLRQEFVFRHDARDVAGTKPSDLADAGRARMLKCVAPVAGRPDRPRYPADALAQQRAGRVMLRLRFVAPDQPPQIQQFPARWSRDLSASAAAWAEHLRMPCHQGGPVEAMWTFLFQFSEDPRLSTLKDMPLVTFLSAVKDVQRLKARHDFNAMGCPFDVKLTYLQPHLPNEVGEVGEPQPGRSEFLDWLATLTLDMPDRTASHVLGSQATISVPCGKLQLD